PCSMASGMRVTSFLRSRLVPVARQHLAVEGIIGELPCVVVAVEGGHAGAQETDAAVAQSDNHAAHMGGLSHLKMATRAIRRRRGTIGYGSDLKVGRALLIIAVGIRARGSPRYPNPRGWTSVGCWVVLASLKDTPPMRPCDAIVTAISRLR